MWGAMAPPAPRFLRPCGQDRYYVNEGILSKLKRELQLKMEIDVSSLHLFIKGGYLNQSLMCKCHGAFHVASPEDLRRGVMFFGVALA